MKKAILIIFGLLVSNVGFAEIKIHHKDENSVSVTRSTWNESIMWALAAEHCTQYEKFAFAFGAFNKKGVPDEKGKPTRLIHCSKTNLIKSPLTGKHNIYWTNYDKTKVKKELEKFEKIEGYKKTCSALGFELGTDRFTDCTLKLFVADNKETTQIVQSSSGAREIIIRDPDRERRIGIKAFSDLVNGKCQVNLLSKNPCQF